MPQSERFFTSAEHTHAKCASDDGTREDSRIQCNNASDIGNQPKIFFAADFRATNIIILVDHRRLVFTDRDTTLPIHTTLQAVMVRDTTVITTYWQYNTG